MFVSFAVRCRDWIASTGLVEESVLLFLSAVDDVAGAPVVRRLTRSGAVRIALHLSPAAEPRPPLREMKRGATTCVAPRGRMSGGVLLSHAVARAVPSALKGLASGFGMGPGVSPSLWPP